MKTILVTARVLGALALAWFGFLFFAMGTTSGWYLVPGWWSHSIGYVVVTSFIAFFPAALVTWVPFLGCSWRVKIAGMAAITLLAVASAETFGRAEELLVLRHYGAEPAEKLAFHRSWPFEHHSMAYNPGYGWCGWD